MTKKGIIPFFIFFFIFFKDCTFCESLFKKNEKINTSADSITYNTRLKTYKASGNVVITGENKQLSGDIVFVDQNSQIISITGNAFFKTGNDVLTGESIFFNYKTEKGIIRNGKIFISDMNFYIRGKKIEKISENVYIAEDASLSSCDNPDKDWEFTAKKIKAEIDGYGYAFNMKLKTMQRPMFYFPFLYFPVKTKRQSGLLMPQIEYSSEYGLDYNQPLYLVLSDQADLTLYYNFIEKRADRTGAEFRYMHSQDSFTQILYDQINNDPYLYNEYKFDDPEFENQDRYWFRMKSDFLSDSGFKTSIDLDIVSDPDYLTDFDKGYMGFDFTEKVFSKNFSRNIDPDDEMKRTNRVYSSKNFGRNTFEAEFLWMDNLIIDETGKKDYTVQKLPRLSFYNPRTVYDFMPFQTSFTTEYNYFHRTNGEKGHRANITPKIYLPFNLGRFAYIEPGAYINETVWYTENPEKDEQYDKSFRQLYGFDLKTSSSLYKVYNIFGENIEKIKHTIIPELNYHFIPEEEQSDLPDFEDFDRIEETNELEFKLTQTLTSKNIIPSKENSEEKKYDYHEFLRLSLSQKYDLADDKIVYNTSDEYELGRFKPLEAYLKITPLKNINFEFTGEYDHYLYLVNKRNFALNLYSDKGSKLRLEHRFTYEENKSAVISGELVLSPAVTLLGSYERIYMENDIEKNEYEKEFGFNYKSQCWDAGILYTEEEDEKRVSFIINLKNFGGIYPGITESDSD
jgi:LPS-assembly protein